MPVPSPIFLDTNVYIIGAADAGSPEASILRWAGFGARKPGPVEIIVSPEILEQILRVAKRLRGKDWGGEILGHIWQDLQLRYVILDPEELAEIEASSGIPREDGSTFLTARAGQARCLISANHELVKALAASTGEFECLTPEMFVSKYMRTDRG